jgi:hypothetical protein
MDSERLRDVVKKSSSIAEIIRLLGITQTGSSYRVLRSRLDEDGIDYSHIPRGRGSNKGRKFDRDSIPLSEVMRRGSDYSRFNLKRRILSAGILPEVCSICGLGNEWNGSRLVMVLDHINGIRDDNRLENLRLLCPNCNSQQPTFSGRNKCLPRARCCDCGIVIGRGSVRCRKCSAIERGRRSRKVVRPGKDELASDMLSMSWVRIGEKYGVSDNAVRKWARGYGL